MSPLVSSSMASTGRRRKSFRNHLKKRSSTTSTKEESASCLLEEEQPQKEENAAQPYAQNKDGDGINNDDPWNERNFQEMVDLWDLSQQEQEDVRSLQQPLSDLNHWKNDPFEVVRYYKEYNRSIPKTVTMFRKMIEWRIANNIDTFLERYGEPPKLFHYLPTFLCEGLDRDDDPIYVERTGASDPYGLLCSYGGPSRSVEPLADYTEFIREITTSRQPRKPTTPSQQQDPSNNNNSDNVPYCWQRDYYEPLVGRRMKQFTVIMDMEGLHPRHMRGGLLGLLKRMARISQDMYAGFGKRVFILRAPAIFQWGWNHIVKHFFDEHIRNLIVFTDPENYMEILDQYIDIRQLPECLTAPGIADASNPKGAMPGYFQKIHLGGGMVPKSEDDYIPAFIGESSGAAGGNRINKKLPSFGDEDITIDGCDGMISSPSNSSDSADSNKPLNNNNSKVVRVKSSSLLVGVTSSTILKGIWQEDEQNAAADTQTQVTVLSGSQY